MAKGRGGFIGQDGLNAPDSPTGVSGTSGDSSVSVAFTAPTDVGGSAITGYRAQSNTGVGASGTSSPINVTGLSNGTSYTFNVWAINAFGYSAPSDASSGVTPKIAEQGFFMSGKYSYKPCNHKRIFLKLQACHDFGDLAQPQVQASALSSATRGVIGGGFDNSNYGINTISFFVFGTTGSGSDFGDLTVGRRGICSTSSSTRGFLVVGGKLSKQTK